MSEKQYKFKGVVIRCTYDTPDYKIYAMDVSKIHLFDKETERALF